MSVQENGRKLVDSFSNVAKRLDGTVVMAGVVGLHIVPANNELGIESHFQRGMPIKVCGRSKPVIVNLHYYGCSMDDTGKKINFNVEVYEKKVDGRTYTYLDLHKAEGQSVANLKFNLDHPELKGNVKIAGTDAYICIMPRHKAENAQVVEEDGAVFYSTDEEMKSRDINKNINEGLVETKLNRNIDELVVQLQQRCKNHNA